MQRGNEPNYLQPPVFSLIPGTDPPADWVIEPCFDDALPDYDTAPDLAYANE